MKKSTVIYGPPGTGKSTEIIRRMKEAISNGVNPNKIGLCSFTKAAAHELAHRVGVRPGQNISTLHSYAFRLCELSKEQIVDRTKLKEFSQISKIETTGANIYEQDTLGPGDYYLAMYGYMRSILETDPVKGYRAGSREGTLDEFRYFIETYDKWKRTYGYFDFSDMLTGALDKPAPDLDILFLDEAQDFSPSQWLLIESWLPSINEVVLALDDDQTLYKFTGADPDGGPGFERRHGSSRVVLNQSYRVPANIHALATKYIKKVTNRVEKEYFPVSDGGTVNRFGSVTTTPVPDVKEETLILYRNHSLSEGVRSWLIERGIPYLVDNGMPGPLQSYLANAIMVWKQAQNDFEKIGQALLTPSQWGMLKRCASPRHSSSMNENRIDGIIKNPWYAVLKVSTDLLNYYRKLERVYGTTRPETKIHLSSIHGAKGREADRVILINGMSTKTAAAYGHNPDPEIRAFYVGVTRARHRLDIVYSENPVPDL